MRGRSHVPSFCGAFASLLVYLIVAVYGLMKFIHLQSRHNPNISTFLEQSALDSETSRMNFKDQPIRFAFGLEGYLDRETKFDSRYVKIFSRLFYTIDGVKGEKIIPHRRCRSEDFDKFAPASPEAEGLL